jgi:hypothetical protein
MANCRPAPGALPDAAWAARHFPGTIVSGNGDSFAVSMRLHRSRMTRRDVLSSNSYIIPCAACVLPRAGLGCLRGFDLSVWTAIVR